MELSGHLFRDTDSVYLMYMWTKDNEGFLFTRRETRVFAALCGYVSGSLKFLGENSSGNWIHYS